MNALDWRDGVVVCVAALVIIAFGYREEFRARRRQRATGPVVEAAPAPVVIDHALCRADDCGRELCYCNRPTACPGMAEPATCTHHEFLCEDHRLECTDCLIDYVSEVA